MVDSFKIYGKMIELPLQGDIIDELLQPNGKFRIQWWCGGVV
jgi:hypothetical protein